MTLIRSIPTRAVEAVWKVARASSEHVTHTGGVGIEGDPDFKPPRIFMGALLDGGSIPLLAPQIHIYHPIAGRREIGTSGIDNRDFDVEVEYFFPQTFAGVVEPGANHLVDWVEALMNEVIRGARPRHPAGILADPDYPVSATQAPMITTGIAEIVYHPLVARSDSLVAYATITFTTKEDAEGRRPYE